MRRKKKWSPRGVRADERYPLQSGHPITCTESLLPASVRVTWARLTALRYFGVRGPEGGISLCIEAASRMARASTPLRRKPSGHVKRLMPELSTAESLLSAPVKRHGPQGFLDVIWNIGIEGGFQSAGLAPQSVQARRDLVARDALWKLVVFDLHGDPLKPEHRKIWWSRGCVWKLLEIGNQELDEI